MKKIIPVLALIGALAAPAIASAHTAAISLQCPPPGQPGHVVFDFQGFPKTGRNVVDVFVTVDTITIQGGKFGFDGPTSQHDVPFTVPDDNQPHEVVSTTRWYQDGGGMKARTDSCIVGPGDGPPAPPTPTPPVPPTPVPPTPTPPTPVPAKQDCTLGTKCCPVCQSKREYRWLISQRYNARGSRFDGQRIVSAIVKWRGASGPMQRAATKVTRKGKTRLLGYADFRGRVVTKGFSAHITVIGTLSSGRRVVMDEEVQLCIPPEGNPNAPTSSAPPSSSSSAGGAARR